MSGVWVAAVASRKVRMVYNSLADWIAAQGKPTRGEVIRTLVARTDALGMHVSFTTIAAVARGYRLKHAGKALAISVATENQVPPERMLYG